MGANWIDFTMFLALLGLFAYVIIMNRITSLHKTYLFFHILMMLWPLGQFLLSSVENDPLQEVYFSAAFIGLSLIGYGWYLFSLFLSQQIYEFSKTRLLLFGMPALLVSVCIALNPGEAFARFAEGYQERTYGPLFWLFLGVSLLYLSLSVRIMRKTIRTPIGKSVRRQIQLFLTGIALLLSFSLIDIYLNVYLSLDRNVAGLTSAGIFAFGVCFVIAIQRYRLLEMVSIAQRDVIRHMEAGIIVIDEHGIVFDLNPAASRFSEASLGRRFDIERFLEGARGPVSDIMKCFEQPLRSPCRFEVAFGSEASQHVSIQMSPIFDRWRNTLGRVVTLHDVTEWRRLIENLSEANGKLEQLAITDGLTGCYNRRYLYQRLEEEVAEKVRYRVPFSIILFDLDYFKEINDTYGHLIGDQVLRETAEHIRASLRKSDMFARYGGEEFTIYLPHTNREQAEALAERLRSSIEHNRITSAKGELSVTISLGVVSYEGIEVTDEDPKAFLEWMMTKADRALYQAKSLGRNHMSMAE